MGQEPSSKVGTLQRRKKELAEGSNDIPKVGPGEFCNIA